MRVACTASTDGAAGATAGYGGGAGSHAGSGWWKGGPQRAWSGRWRQSCVSSITMKHKEPVLSIPSRTFISNLFLRQAVRDQTGDQHIPGAWQGIEDGKIGVGLGELLNLSIVFPNRFFWRGAIGRGSCR